MAIRESGIAARFLEFDLTEFLFQFIYNGLFCLSVFFINLSNVAARYVQSSFFRTIAGNLMLLIVALSIGITTHEMFFNLTVKPEMFRYAYLIRFLFTHILAFIVIRIIKNQREVRAKEKENDRLKNLYIEAQSQALRNQLNPHFFFNSLSSLSAIVSENPPLAQKYISHLSKIFRVLLQPSKDLVTLREELNALDSYIELIKMRYESGVEISIDIPERYLHFEIPHMSLQPLIENAVKHNIISASRPLKIDITGHEQSLIVTNNIQLLDYPEPGTSTGLTNLSERFLLLLKQPISIKKTEQAFSITLPLKTEINESHHS